MAILNNDFFSLIGFKKRPKAPWGKYYSKKDMLYEIPNISLYDYIYSKHFKFMDNIAMEYYGNKVTYNELYEQIDLCAKAFKNQGIRKGDVVTILSANLMESIYIIFALNKIGAVANVVHPLSAENEIKEALHRYSSVMLVAMDVCYSKIKEYINPYVIGGYCLVLVCMILMVFAYIGLPFKYGAVLESIVYFYVMIMSRFFLHERLSLKRVVGNLIIVCGVAIFSF